MSVIRAAGVLVFRERGQGREYLLLQASYRRHHWTPPKGHVDPGEDEKTAALRETKEEAGLGEGDLRLHPTFQYCLKYNVPKGPKETLYWLGRVGEAAKVTLSDEHQDQGWFTPSEAVRVIGAADERGYLAMLAKADATPFP